MKTRRFKGRILLKIISVSLTVVSVGVAVVILSIAYLGARKAEMADFIAIFFVALSIPIGGTLFVMMNNSFSTLEVDRETIRLKRWVGSRSIAWSDIDGIRYLERWEHVRRYHVESKECYLDIRDSRNKS